MMKLLAIFCLLSIIQNTWSMEVTEESLEEAFGVLNECFQYFDFSYDTDSFRCMDKASEEKHVIRNSFLKEKLRYFYLVYEI